MLKYKKLKYSLILLTGLVMLSWMILVGAVSYQGVVHQIWYFFDDEIKKKKCLSQGGVGNGKYGKVLRISFGGIVVGGIILIGVVIVLCIGLIYLGKENNTRKDVCQNQLIKLLDNNHHISPMRKYLTPRKLSALYIGVSLSILGSGTHFGNLLRLVLKQLQCKITINLLQMVIITGLSGFAVVLLVVWWIFFMGYFLPMMRGNQNIVGECDEDKNVEKNKEKEKGQEKEKIKEIQMPKIKEDKNQKFERSVEEEWEKSEEENKNNERSKKQKQKNGKNYKKNQMNENWKKDIKKEEQQIQNRRKKQISDENKRDKKNIQKNKVNNNRSDNERNNNRSDNGKNNNRSDNEKNGRDEKYKVNDNRSDNERNDSYDKKKAKNNRSENEKNNNRSNNERNESYDKKKVNNNRSDNDRSDNERIDKEDKYKAKNNRSDNERNDKDDKKNANNNHSNERNNNRSDNEKNDRDNKYKANNNRSNERNSNRSDNERNERKDKHNEQNDRNIQKNSNRFASERFEKQPSKPQRNQYKLHFDKDENNQREERIQTQIHYQKDKQYSPKTNHQKIFSQTEQYQYYQRLSPKSPFHKKQQVLSRRKNHPKSPHNYHNRYGQNQLSNSAVKSSRSRDAESVRRQERLSSKSSAYLVKNLQVGQQYPHRYHHKYVDKEPTPKFDMKKSITERYGIQKHHPRTKNDGNSGLEMIEQVRGSELNKSHYLNYIMEQNDNQNTNRSRNQEVYQGDNRASYYFSSPKKIIGIVPQLQQAANENSYSNSNDNNQQSQQHNGNQYDNGGYYEHEHRGGNIKVIKNIDNNRYSGRNTEERNMVPSLSQRKLTQEQKKFYQSINYNSILKKQPLIDKQYDESSKQSIHHGMRKEIKLRTQRPRPGQIYQKVDNVQIGEQNTEKKNKGKLMLIDYIRSKYVEG